MGINGDDAPIWRICPYRGKRPMADTKKKPGAKSGKAKKQAIKSSRQAKESKKEPTKPEEA
jgi:hypothetical protein